MRISINKALEMQKSLRERMSQLTALAAASTQVERYHYAVLGQDRVVEPTYDVKKLDRRVTELRNAIFEISSAIKDENAKHQMEISVDYASLMAPLE